MKTEREFDRVTFEHCIQEFLTWVAARSGSPFESFLVGLPYMEEGYKNELFFDASRRFREFPIREKDIGSGKIYFVVEDVMCTRTNNLIDHHQVAHFKKVSKTSMEEVEQVLYNILKADVDQSLFNQTTNLFGKKYDLISFLFFIRDESRYLPIRPTFFDEIFSFLGIDYTMTGKCSWDNYSGFIDIVSQIRNDLQSYFDGLNIPHVNVTLIDAHSFLWMLRSVKRYFMENAETIAFELTGPLQKNKIGEVNTRLGQGTYRKHVLEIWNETCSITNCDDTSLLIASHIKPWRNCTENAEWLNGYNGLLLTPNLDALFDGGFISFNDDGSIMISPMLSKINRAALGLNENIRLKRVMEPHKPFLKYHRDMIFRGQSKIAET